MRFDCKVQSRLLHGELERCQAVGMDDCIIKPVSIPGLDAKLRSIQEGSGGWWSSYGGWWGRGYQGMSQNISQSAGGSSSSQDGPLAPGTLSIRGNVTITFDLE